MGTTGDGVEAIGFARGWAGVDSGVPVPFSPAEASNPGAAGPDAAAATLGVALATASSEGVELDGKTRLRAWGKRKSSIRFTTSDQEVPHNATAGMATTHANMINARPATAADDRMTSHASLRAHSTPPSPPAKVG